MRSDLNLLAVVRTSWYQRINMALVRKRDALEELRLDMWAAGEFDGVGREHPTYKKLAEGSMSYIKAKEILKTCNARAARLEKDLLAKLQEETATTGHTPSVRLKGIWPGSMPASKTSSSTEP